MADKNPPLSTIDPEDELVIGEVHRLAIIQSRIFDVDRATADDISQTVLARLLHLKQKGSLNIESIENPEAYLYRIVKNELLDYKKKRNAYEVSIDDESVNMNIASRNDDFEAEALFRERKLILSEVMSEFTEWENEILRLLILNYNQKEIAIRQRISHDNARQEVSRLRSKLRKRIMARLLKD